MTTATAGMPTVVLPAPGGELTAPHPAPVRPLRRIQPTTTAGMLRHAAGALDRIATATQFPPLPGLHLGDITWTRSGDLAGRPVLTVDAAPLDAAAALASRLGFVPVPAGDDVLLWEGTIRGLGAAIRCGGRE